MAWALETMGQSLTEDARNIVVWLASQSLKYGEDGRTKFSVDELLTGKENHSAYVLETLDIASACACAKLASTPGIPAVESDIWSQTWMFLNNLSSAMHPAYEVPNAPHLQLRIPSPSLQMSPSLASDVASSPRTGSPEISLPPIEAQNVARMVMMQLRQNQLADKRMEINTGGKCLGENLQTVTASSINPSVVFASSSLVGSFRCSHVFPDCEYQGTSEFDLTDHIHRNHNDGLDPYVMRGLANGSNKVNEASKPETAGRTEGVRNSSLSPKRTVVNGESGPKRSMSAMSPVTSSNGIIMLTGSPEYTATDVVTYCAICDFVATPEELQRHYDTEHFEDAFANGAIKNGQKSKANGPKKLAGTKVNLKRAKRAGSEVSNASTTSKKLRESPDSEMQGNSNSVPHQEICDENTAPLIPVRYQTRGRINPSKQDLRLQARQQLTSECYRILSGLPNDDSNSEASLDSVDNSDDPFARLRMLESLLSTKLSEVEYDESTQLKDGYTALYKGRLQSLVEDSDKGNQVLRMTAEILDIVERGGVEYQCSETTLLENIREAQSKAKETPKLFLCSHARFYGKDLGDSGWGCGYRNAQMLISVLLEWPAVSEQLTKELDGKSVPSIPRLQELVQRAWIRGFDFFASAELDHSVTETSKWIGTTEIQALFHSMRIECIIRDFGSVIGAADVQDQVYTFVQEYFTVSDEQGYIAPMYIQYSGHSRTIIGLDATGIEQVEDDRKPKTGKGLPHPLPNADKLGLIILDPGETPSSLKLTGKPTRKWYKQHFLCNIKAFKEETYQILYFTGNILSDYDYERLKRPGEGHQSKQYDFS